VAETACGRLRDPGSNLGHVDVLEAGGLDDVRRHPGAEPDDEGVVEMGDVQDGREGEADLRWHLTGIVPLELAVRKECARRAPIRQAGRLLHDRRDPAGGILVEEEKRSRLVGPTWPGPK
jgi:hypothetical protein